MDFLDSGSINGRIAQFDKRHGASVYINGWLYFEDGATRESNPMGAIVDPPTDPLALAKQKYVYRLVILKYAKEAFDRTKAEFISYARANLNSMACGPAAPAEEAAAQLKALQKKTLEAKAAADAAGAAVQALEQPQYRQRESQNAANRTSNEKLLELCSKIEV